MRRLYRYGTCQRHGAREWANVRNFSKSDTIYSALSLVVRRLGYELDLGGVMTSGYTSKCWGPIMT